MNRNAIKIDLSTFFDDERKMCCVLVDPSWENVACLEKRVQYLFDIDCVRFLNDDGCFLPPLESIEIIKYCKEIKAFVPKDVLKLRKKDKSKKYENEEKPKKSMIEEPSSAQNNTQKKRKINCLESSQSLNSFSNISKRSKNSNKNDSSECPQLLVQKRKKSKVSLLTTDCEEPTVEKQLSKSKSEIDESCLKENTLVPFGAEEDLTKLAIRENNLNNTLNDEMNDVAESPLRIPSSTFLNESKMLEGSIPRFPNSKNSENPFKNSTCITSHKYFNESGEIINFATETESKPTHKKKKEHKTILIFRSTLNDITNNTQPQKPRIFNLKSVNSGNNATKKQIIEIQEELVLPRLSIQNGKNSISLVTEETTVNETKPNNINETTNNKSQDATSFTDTSVRDKNNDLIEVGGKELEDKTFNEVHNKSEIEQSISNETSMMPLDCVDLSIEIDEEDMKLQKEETRDMQEKKHDVTENSKSRKSSVSDIEEISEIIDLNETEDNSNTPIINTTGNNIDKSSFEDIRINKIMPFSTDLKDLPNAEDIIIFKVPYLTKCKEYVNTNFIAGKIEYINRRTKTMKILIKDGISELYYVPNQFVCNLDDSKNYDQYLQLKLSDMREPKLFSKS